MRGLFYQRAGQSIDETNSAYRRVASHLEPIEVPYGEDRSIVGGHYDAGDYNPRGHYDVVHILLLAYEMFPEKFFDGQLDIPERANGVPDIVDEAMWGLQALLALQDSDGGVGFDAERGHFIESRSDPNFIEIAERDPWIQETYAKHAQGTLIVAALAATAARTIQQAWARRHCRPISGLGHSSLHLGPGQRSERIYRSLCVGRCRNG